MDELPNKVQGFLNEYKALCDKWKCLVLSEGEPVVVSEEDDPSSCYNYWGIEERTLDNWREEVKQKENVNDQIA